MTAVTGNTVTTNVDVTGATANDVATYDGTNVVWAPAVPTRYTETITPVVNTQFVVTHSLNLADPMVQVRDATTNEVVDVEIDVLSVNTVGITSSTTDDLRVVVL